MALFETGNFKLHSGQSSTWKINCDALTDSDIAALAYLIARQISFADVVGIPEGGTRLASALEQYRSKSSDITLIVDDVLTTGASMETMRTKHPGSLGIVIFARGKLPIGVGALFQCNVEG